MNRWSRLWLYSSLFHGAVAALLTLLIVVPALEIPRIISGGGAGTWFTIGYIMYLLGGPLGSIGFSVLYAGVGTGGSALNSRLGWLHLTLTNLGVMSACYQLIYGGYIAGYMQHIAPSITGEPVDLGAVHLFLVRFVTPIGASVLLTALSLMIGIVNIMILLRKES